MVEFFSSLEFEYPYFLLLIILFIICAYLCKQRTSSYYFPHIALLNNSKVSSNNLLFLLKYITIIFAIIALSSPIQKQQSENITNSGLNILLNIDSSGSMKQIGFNTQNPNQSRWDIVKELVIEFVQKRENDNLGVIVFGTNVLKASPLTFDKNALKNMIRYLQIGVVGEKTALLDSIANSINVLKNTNAKSKILITLTDGDDTASSIPLDVVEKLIKKYNIKIYNIGIGEANSYVLKKLSSINEGKYFEAKDKEDLKNIYETINKLEKSEIEGEKIVFKKYYFFYPLFISVMSLILFLFFRIKSYSN